MGKRLQGELGVSATERDISVASSVAALRKSQKGFAVCLAIVVLILTGMAIIGNLSQ